MVNGEEVSHVHILSAEWRTKFKLSMASKFSANVTKLKKLHRIKIICVKPLKAD